MSCQAVNEFKGGYTHKLLSRSRLFERPSQDGRLLAAFGEEATKSVSVMCQVFTKFVCFCTGQNFSRGMFFM